MREHKSNHHSHSTSTDGMAVRLQVVREQPEVQPYKIRWYQPLRLGKRIASNDIGSDSSLEELDRWLEGYTSTFDHVPVEALASIPSLTNEELFRNRLGIGYRCAKRAVDVSASLVLLVAALPILLMAGLFIRLDSPGPVLFRQDRVGVDGKIFALYKLRTMQYNAPSNGPLSTTVPNDPRVTSVGRILRKFRVDEIPQLWCVLRGDMSLIGPRPELPSSHAYLATQMPGFGLRILIRPGITGWAQVTSGYADTFEKHQRRLEHDLYYLRTVSPTLDARVVVRTLKVIATSKGH